MSQSRRFSRRFAVWLPLAMFVYIMLQLRFPTTTINTESSSTGENGLLSVMERYATSAAGPLWQSSFFNDSFNTIVGRHNTDWYNTTNTARTDRTTTAQVQQESTDWYDAKIWNDHKYTRNCIVLHNICHAQFEWFVRDDAPLPALHIRDFFEVRSVPTGYPLHLNITRKSASHSCTTSRIPNHMVLQSSYNDMLGEFYARTLLGFQTMLERTQINLTAFQQSTQLYLHLQYPEKTLLDSHVLFTEPYRQLPLLDVKELLHNTRCRCLPRLFLCGYHPAAWSFGDVVNPASRMVVPYYQHDQNTVTHNTSGSDEDNNNVTTVLTLKPGPGLLIEQGGRSRSQKEMARRNVQLLNALTQFKQGNHVLLARIAATRRALLQAHQVPREKQHHAYIIGLADRKSRRKWNNIDEVLQQCNNHAANYFGNNVTVICVPVSIDSDVSNPYSQVVQHGVLDMLVGIHGAQLTEAVWMPSQSLVVELLPYVPADIMLGRWTRTTDAPTPWGAILYNTSLLHHVGIPLQRDSATTCHEFNDTGTKEFLRCWRQISWDERDFVVNATLLLQQIGGLAAGPLLWNHHHQNQYYSSCTEWRQAARDDIVLYNVVCNRTAGENAAPHQFYWKKI